MSGALTVLHPRHKLVYFRNAKWSEEWIRTAEEIVRTVYELDYKDTDVVDSEKVRRLIVVIFYIMDHY